MSMFDTHCHLNFKTFEEKVSMVIEAAKKVGVNYFVVPGTDIENSKKAAEMAEKFDEVYAAIGIHPHHVYQSQASNLKIIERLLTHPKVVAVGEVGIDRHYYQKTKYTDYQVNKKFIELQKEFLKAQIGLAIKFDKSLILHNREAKDDLLGVLREMWDRKLEGRTVFHCCEPDEELLEFAKEYKIYIGIDGDVTYNKKKQVFIKRVPLELVVLETDSPLLRPTGIKFPNEPKNLPLIADFLAKCLQISINQLIETTTLNAQKLFSLL